MSSPFFLQETGKILLLTAPLGIATTIILEMSQQLAFKHASGGERTKPLWMIIGAGLYVPQQLCWMFVLTILPLAIATPFLGASYVAVPFASSVLFKEKINAKGWLGICLIVAGIALISREVAP
ncbi:MAG: EamA family transporter [Candidatus Obscuribacterales bacterium]|nr:EamA family transporter [Candidatus Obscuribacterales bacterium]